MSIAILLAIILLTMSWTIQPVKVKAAFTRCQPTRVGRTLLT